MDTGMILTELKGYLPRGFGWKIRDDVRIELTNRLDSLSDTQRNELHSKIWTLNLKKPMLVTIVGNVLFGTLGVGRFMIGDIALGFARLALQILVIVLAMLSGGDEESIFAIIGGFCLIAMWIWWFVDIILVEKKLPMQNLRKVLLAIDSVKNAK